jgi:hypothetical protein
LAQFAANAAPLPDTELADTENGIVATTMLIIPATRLIQRSLMTVSPLMKQTKNSLAAKTYA